MTPHLFLRILKQNALWFLILPGVTLITVFFFTRNEPKVYQSQATLYTGLASGYTLLSDQKNTYTNVDNAFDNLLTTLNSKETLHQIAVSLLTQHLQLQQPDSMVLAAPGFQKLQKAIPSELYFSLLAGGSADYTYHKVDSLSRAEVDNPIKSLLNKSTSYYSIDRLSGKLKGTRKKLSDMLIMEYEADDPAVAQQTLNLAIKILNTRYTALKTTEATSVVDYYEGETQKAKQRLAEAEQSLQSFSVKHKVLNFDEDAKNVTQSRETLTSEYNQELMRNKAAKAAMDALNRRMGQRGDLLAASDELKKKQTELTEAENKLINAKAYGSTEGVVANLQANVDRASEELKSTARKYYMAGDSQDAIPQETILNEWLTKVLAFEESAARLELYKKRLGEYEAKTEEYSPLASQLRQLNRDLSVAEKEYLTATQSLNQALTHRKDISIDGALTVLDAPDFPTAKGSKRWLFLALAIGIGLFLALLITAIRFLLDRRISSPEQAEMIIGRPVTALFPLIKMGAPDAKANRAVISMFEQLCSAINIEIVQATAKPHPPVITLFSVRSRQGKTWIASGLARLYGEAGQRVAYCYPDYTSPQKVAEQNGVTFLPYMLRPNFMNINDLRYLIDEQENFDAASYDLIILELPSLTSSPIPVNLLNKSYVSLLVVDANLVWARTERQLLEMYKKIASHPILTVLNKVEDDYIEDPNQEDAVISLNQTRRLLNFRRKFLSPEQG
ncbi:hypothetical protein GCM10023189_08660 [Nibrella saemangeumensis]|uniref:Lipopolysaccharide biosynthesis protein n=1 Tax=Nibrella saemangeumensis TaxID=1084526 RepID=A0ABP8MI37_9BACT